MIDPFTKAALTKTLSSLYNSTPVSELTKPGPDPLGRMNASALNKTTTLLKDLSGENGPEAGFNAVSNFAFPASVIGVAGAAGPQVRALAKAVKMEKAGNHFIDDIFDSTGWWRGPDGHWRMEVNDREFGLKKHIKDLPVVGGEPAEGVIAHPGLSEKYTKGLEVRQRSPEESKSARGEYNPEAERFSVSGDLSFVDQLRIALHELQHRIQHYEGWPESTSQGTNTEHAGSKYAYLKNWGETEARVVEQRRMWSDEMRKRYPFKDHFWDELKRLDESPDAYPSIFDIKNNVRRALGKPPKVEGPPQELTLPPYEVLDE